MSIRSSSIHAFTSRPAFLATGLAFVVADHHSRGVRVGAVARAMDDHHGAVAFLSGRIAVTFAREPRLFPDCEIITLC